MDEKLINTRILETRPGNARWKMNTNAKISAEFSVQKVLKTEKEMAVPPPETRVKNRTVEAASLSDVTAPSTLPLLTLTTA